MTTFDIGNNLKQIIFFVFIVLGCGVLAIKGFSTNDITSIIAALVGVAAAIGLAGSDKLKFGSGEGEEWNEKTE